MNSGLFERTAAVDATRAGASHLQVGKSLPDAKHDLYYVLAKQLDDEWGDPGLGMPDNRFKMPMSHVSVVRQAKTSCCTADKRRTAPRAGSSL